MRKSQSTLHGSLLLGLVLFMAGPALANDPSVAWGTASANPSSVSPVMDSATYQNTEMKNAQMVTMGKNVTIINNSINTCGSCTYYTITGNDNSIAENSVVSTNNGTLQNEGSISTFFATNIQAEAPTGAIEVRDATTTGEPAVFAGPK